MAKIDELVLSMKFDNSRFKAAVQDTLGILDRLKSSLKIGGVKDAFKGSAQDVNGLGAAVKNVDLSKLSGDVGSIKSEFSALSVVGKTALGKLTVDAMNLGRKMVNVISGPLVQGGMNRAKNIEQARFMLKGLDADVAAIEKAAMNAVEGTAYGFDEAARAASQFYASNVRDADEMERALLGISGAAAMTGASYDDIANIFTTVAGNGRLMSEQLNQFSSRGLNVAAKMAEKMNVTEEQFRKMVSEGKVSFKDFYETMSSAYGEHAKKAGDTFQGAMANARAPLARIGADVASVYLKQMTGLFNAIRPFLNVVHGALGPVIELINSMQTASIGRLTQMFESLTAGLTKGGSDKPPILGWIGDIGQGIRNLADQFLSVVSMFRNAWQDVFGREFRGIRPLVEAIASSFLKFTQSVQVSKVFLYNLYHVIRPFLAVFKLLGAIAVTVAGGLIKVGSAIVQHIVPHLLTFARYAAKTVTNLANMLLGIKIAGKGFDGFINILVKLIEWIGIGLKFVTDFVDAFVYLYRSIRYGDSLDQLMNPSSWNYKMVASFGKSIRSVADALGEIKTNSLETLTGAFRLLVTFTKEAGNTILAFVKTIDFGWVDKMFGWVDKLKVKNPFENFGKTSFDFDGAEKSIQSMGASIRESFAMGGRGGRAGGILALVGLVRSAFDKIKVMAAQVDWDSLFTGLGGAIRLAYMGVTGQLKDTYEYIKESLTSVDWSDVGSTIVEKIVTGLTAVKDFGGKIADFFKETITSTMEAIDPEAIWNNIKDFGGNVLDAVGDAFSGAKEAVEGIGNVEATVVVETEGLEELQTIAKDTSLVGRLRGIGESLRDLFMGADGDTKDLSALHDIFGETFTGILDGFTTTAKNAGGTIKQAFEWLSNPITTGIEKLKEAFTDQFKGLDDTAATTVEASITSISDRVQRMDLNMLFNSISNLLQGASLFMLAKAIKDSLDAYGQVAKSLSGLMDGLKDAVTGFADAAKIEARGNMILKLAASVVIIAAALWLLSKIPADDLTRGLVSIAAVMVGLAVAMFALSKLDLNPAMGTSILAIAAALFIMATAIRMFSGMEPETIGLGILYIVATIGMIGLAFKAFPEKNVLAAATAMLLLAAAMGTFRRAIEKMAALDWGTFWDGIGKIAIVLGGFVAVLRGLSGAQVVYAGVAILLLAASMHILKDAIIELSGISWWDLSKSVGALVTSLLIMTVALAALSKIGPSVLIASTALLMVSVGLLAVANAVSIMGNLDFGSFIQGIVGLIVVLAALVYAVTKLPASSVMALGLTMLSLAASVLILSVAMKVLGSMEWEQIGVAIAGMVVAMAALVGAAILLNKFGGASIGVQFVALAVGLGILIAAIILLGSIDTATMIQGLVGLAAALAVLLGAAWIASLAPVATGLIILTAALIGLGVAGILIAAGLWIASHAFTNFVDGLVVLVAMGPQLSAFGEQLGSALMSIAGPVALLGLALIPFGAGLLFAAPGLILFSIACVIFAAAASSLVGSFETFVSNMSSLNSALAEFAGAPAEGLRAMAEVGEEDFKGLAALGLALGGLNIATLGDVGARLKSLGEGMKSFAGGAHLFQTAMDKIKSVDSGALREVRNAIDDAFSSGFTDSINRAAGEMEGAISNMINAIAGKSGDFNNAGTELANAFADGVKTGESNAKSAGEGLGKAAAAAARSGHSAMVSAGEYIAQGLAQGIQNGTSAAVAAARSMAAQVAAAAKVELDTHSPSRVFAQIGNWVAIGLAGGIISNSGVAIGASSSMARGVIAAATGTLEIHSPSRVFRRIGGNVNQGFADGIKASEHAPANAMGRTLDNMISVTDGKTKELENANGSFYDALVSRFNDNPATKRLEALLKHSKALHAMSIKEKRIKDEEERERKEDEREQIYRDVEDAKKGIADAKREAADAKQEAADNRANAKKTSKQARDVERENRDAQRKIEDSERKYTESQQKIRDAEKKYRRAMSKKERYEYEQYGTEAGVAFVDGVAEGFIDESDKLPSLHEIMGEVLYKELDKIKEESNNFIGIFEGVQSISSQFKKLGDHANELRRAFTRLSRSTSPRAFNRNLGDVFDSVVSIGKEIVGFMDILDKFKPYLPMVLGQLDKLLPTIIPVVAQFAPGLAATLGGGLEAALPAIAGPAAAIVAAVVGIGYLLYDSGGEQRILKFLRSMVDGIVNILNNLPKLITNFAIQMINGLTNLLIELPRMISALIVGLVNGLINLVQELPQRLPEIILALVDGLVRVLTETPTIIIDLAVALLDALLRVMIEVIPQLLIQLPGMFLKVGVAIVQGIVQGIQNATRSIFNGVKKTVDTIVGWFKSLLGIRSPSRVFAELGGYLMEGMAKGIDENQDLTQDSVEDAAKAVIRAAQEILEEGLDNDMSLTLTPVLDMSLAESTLSDFISEAPVLNAEQTSGVAHSVGSIRQSAEDQLIGGNVTTINYTQNNTSPKPLSTIDIYRNTQRQLENMK